MLKQYVADLSKLLPSKRSIDLDVALPPAHDVQMLQLCVTCMRLSWWYELLQPAKLTDALSDLQFGPD